MVTSRCCAGKGFLAPDAFTRLSVVKSARLVGCAKCTGRYRYEAKHPQTDTPAASLIKCDVITL